MKEAGNGSDWLWGNWKASLLCAIIASSLVFVSLFGSWYNISAAYDTSEGEPIGESDTNLALRQFTYYWEWQGVTRENWTISYSDLTQDEDWEIVDVFGLTQILTILALLLIPLMVASTLVIARRKIGNRIGIIIAVLALIFTIASPAYFAIAFPSALEGEATRLGSPPVSGFIGSGGDEYLGYPGEVSWGPAWAWYLMVVASVFVLIGTIMLVGMQAIESKEGPNIRKGAVQK